LVIVNAEKNNALHALAAIGFLGFFFFIATSSDLQFRQFIFNVLYVLIDCCLKRTRFTTNFKSVNLLSKFGRSYKHYVIKFVSDLRQVGGFLWVLQFPLPIKLTI
jgi:hypothetical protein